jgi:hypothetical protein
MLGIDAADAAQAFSGALVVEVADQGVGRIGRNRGDASAVQDRRGLLDQSGLRIVGVDVKVLRHGRDG